MNRDLIMLRALGIAATSASTQKRIQTIEAKYTANDARFRVEQNRLLDSAMVAYAKGAEAKGRGRPAGSLATEDGDFIAALVAKMVLTSDKPPRFKNEALRRGLEFARSTGLALSLSPMVGDAAILRRLANFLRDNEEMLTAVLALQGWPPQVAK